MELVMDLHEEIRSILMIECHVIWVSRTVSQCSARLRGSPSGTFTEIREEIVLFVVCCRCWQLFQAFIKEGEEGENPLF